jgi:hypothetical protein
MVYFVNEGLSAPQRMRMVENAHSAGKCFQLLRSIFTGINKSWGVLLIGVRDVAAANQDSCGNLAAAARC